MMDKESKGPFCERRIAELEEALHEIYTKACQAMNSDDDLYLYSFASDVIDIALAAVRK